MAVLLSMFKRHHPAQLIANLYFLLLAGSNFIGTLLFARVGLLDVLILVLCLTPILSNNRTLYILFGWLSTLVFGYLLLAVTDDFLDFQRGEDHYGHPWEYFGVGYLLTVSGVFCSILYIAKGGVEKNPAVGAGATL